MKEIKGNFPMSTPKPVDTAWRADGGGGEQGEGWGKRGLGAEESAFG